ncbi:MAG: DUF4089 domain-containing protein [Acidimicrobiales bacterium]
MTNSNSQEHDLIEQEALHAGALVGLAIKDAHLPGVASHFRTLRDRAELVMAFPLPEDIEPAPVFRP